MLNKYQYLYNLNIPGSQQSKYLKNDLMEGIRLHLNMLFLEMNLLQKLHIKVSTLNFQILLIENYQTTHCLSFTGVKMFSKKAPKSESSSKLLKILTKRSSYKRLSVKRDVYDQWPTQIKPSLFNYSTKYLKCINTSSREKSPAKQNFESIKKYKSSSVMKKVPAVFSTCTTMQLLSSAQQKIEVASKLTTTPKNDEELKQNCSSQKSSFTPYMTPFQDQSQITEQNDSAIYQSHQENNYVKMDSKYENRPKTVNQSRQGSNHSRRLVKTAAINRQRCEPYQPNKEAASIKRPLNSETFLTDCAKPLSIRIGQNQTPKLTSKTFLKSRCPGLTQINSQKSFQFSYDHPMRLKDFQTNFQAFKVISELIDHQMRWQPKKKRPKSSVSFRKYKVSANV